MPTFFLRLLDEVKGSSVFHRSTRIEHLCLDSYRTSSIFTQLVETNERCAVKLDESNIEKSDTIEVVTYMYITMEYQTMGP